MTKNTILQIGQPNNTREESGMSRVYVQTVLTFCSSGEQPSQNIPTDGAVRTLKAIYNEAMYGSEQNFEEL